MRRCLRLRGAREGSGGIGSDGDRFVWGAMGSWNSELDGKGSGGMKGMAGSDGAWGTMGWG